MNLLSYRYELIALFALLALAISVWILVTKLRRKKLICVTRDECMNVVTGKYSKIFGVPNEILGVPYYAAVIVYAYVATVRPELITRPVLVTVYAVTTLATLFAARLVYLQAFVIKKWCEWCLAISFASGMIYWLVTLP